MLAFTSETDIAGRATQARGARPARRWRPDISRRFTRTQIAMAALGVVALLQGGLIAFWWTGSFAAVETGSISVSSDPAGVPVAVDGVARGTTPLTLSIDAGSHRVDVGEAPAVRTQTINVAKGGDSSVHLDLRPDAALVAAGASGTGRLHVTADRPGAQVSIDGTARGAAPVTVANLAAGRHQVTVRAGDTTVHRRVDVLAGGVASLIVTMNNGGAFASGWLAISSRVPAQILEDGTLLGTTAMPRIMVPVGRHDLEIANTALGYRVRRTVQIRAGQTTSIALDAPRGTLHVNALPWAEVWIDGQSAGETPIGNLSLPIGEHELIFRHPELGEHRRTVVVGATAPTRVGVDLRK